MNTLLKPGDMIRIREDIKEGINYKMFNDNDIKNSWIKEDMLPAGTLVEIVNISHKQYVVNAIDEIYRPYSDIDDEFWLYTDEMFDPELLVLLLEDRYNL